MWPPGTATNLGLLGAEGVPRILAALVARDDRLTILNAKLTTGHRLRVRSKCAINAETRWSSRPWLSWPP